MVHTEGEEGRSGGVHMRLAFSRFFSPLVALAGEKGLPFTFRLHGARGFAFRRFCNALTHEPDALHVLLVDSEAPVATPGAAWTHLARRSGDEWERPSGVSEEQCQLMVQAIEAWLVADPDTLAEYYGRGFSRRSLPRRRNVEEVPKSQHLPALEAATRHTTKGRYHKTRHLPALVYVLNAQRVRERAPYCDRIFTTLGKLLREL